MAKKKVNLTEAFVCECQECYERLLIIDSARTGDAMKCRCGQEMVVGDIVGEYRKSKEPMFLDASPIN